MRLRAPQARSVSSMPAVLVPRMTAIRSRPQRPRAASMRGASSSRLRSAMRTSRVSQGASEEGGASSGPGTAPVFAAKGTSSSQGRRPLRPARSDSITSAVVAPSALQSAYAVTG